MLTRASTQQIATALETIVQEYTAPNKDPDSTIKCTLVLSGKRVSIEQSQIPAVFTPVTGRLRVKCEFRKQRG